MKMKRVKRLWKMRVQKVYSCLEELRAYDRTWGIVNRCKGFRSAKALWEANPVLCGSTDPKDFGVYSK